MTKRIDCTELILKHFKTQPNAYVKKVDFYVVCGEYGHSPESVGRRLRDLEEAGTIKVDYYDGKYAKNLAQYSLGEVPKKESKYVEVIINGERFMQLI